jgi:hypothetical protein
MLEDQENDGKASALMNRTLDPTFVYVQEDKIKNTVNRKKLNYLI